MRSFVNEGMDVRHNNGTAGMKGQVLGDWPGFSAQTASLGPRVSATGEQQGQINVAHLHIDGLIKAVHLVKQL